jgi:hypothetical protein
LAEPKGQLDDTLQQRWQRVYRRRDSLAETIDRMANTQPRQVRSRIRNVSNFLKRDGSYDAAIVRPDVIAFTQPLLQPSGDDALSDEQLTRAASVGLNSLNCQTSNIERLSQLMIYPAVIIIASIGIYVGFALFVAPEFEQMFEEFGIELPAVTECLLGLARIVRSFGWLMAIMMAALLAIGVLWLLLPGAFISRMKFVNNLFENKRKVMADVALHAAQLRSMGMSANQSFAAASFAAGLSNQEPDKTSNATTNQMPRFELLEFALRQPSNDANNRMLLEVADGYRRRTTTVSDWWIHWLVYGLQLFVMSSVVFLMISMFMPLFSIIGGLTG